jgi:uridine nucleosidase
MHSLFSRLLGSSTPQSFPAQVIHSAGLCTQQEIFMVSLQLLDALHDLILEGESGIDGTDLLPQPTKKALTHCNAIQEMRECLMSCPPDTAWLVTTGTLTNAALLFAVFPEVASHIKGLSIMGGSIGNGFTSVSMGPPYTDEAGETHPRIGNCSPFAEFNIWCDPEASRSLLQNPVLRPKTVLVPLDVTHQAYAGKEVQKLLLHRNGEIEKPSRLRRMFNELLMFFATTYADVFGLKEGPPLHDPLAVAALLADHPESSVRIDFDDGRGEKWNVDVVLEGQELGRTVAKSSVHGTMVPRSLDLKKFWTALEECMARADEATEYRT